LYCSATCFFCAVYLFAQHAVVEADWDKRRPPFAFLCKYSTNVYWPLGFIHILGAALVDKCLPNRINSKTVQFSKITTTTTMQLVIACLKEQKSDLEVTMNYLSTQTRRPHDCLPTLENLVIMSILERKLLNLFETLHFGYYWLSSRIRHSLSSWDVSKMVLLIYCDFPALENIVEELKTKIMTVAASGCDDGLPCMNMNRLVFEIMDEIAVRFIA
jgi:hypothetical protein